MSKSRRSAAVIAAVLALIVGIPVAQSLHGAVFGAPEAAPMPPNTSAAASETASAAPTALPTVTPPAASAAPTAPRVSAGPQRAVDQVLREQHSDGFTGAEDFAAVAQVRTSESGWRDVLHGNVVLPARLDPSGGWLALLIERASLTEPQVRTWIYVVRVRDGAVLAGRRVERSSAIVGWSGHQVVSKQEDGVMLLLADRGRGKVTRIQPAG